MVVYLSTYFPTPRATFLIAHSNLIPHVTRDAILRAMLVSSLP